ncbi:MAG: DedA family protein [Candidatus Omnitrophica bacterium]|nr:DedA family protein [Candidatus Omnitrophota bacterium]
MGFIGSIFDFVFHLDQHLDFIIKSFGSWSYLLFFSIIFAETGLVVTPFLPGDSLLFVLGAFCAKGAFSLSVVLLILIGAAIIGDTVNYAIGKFFGEKILLKGARHLIKKEHIEKTHKFYEKHGGKTIILARFIPVIRTFAPFVAGIGKMNYYKFLIYNVTGGILWVALFVFAGFYFGNLELVKNNFSMVIFAIVIISALPVAAELFKHRLHKK